MFRVIPEKKCQDNLKIAWIWRAHLDVKHCLGVPHDLDDANLVASGQAGVWGHPEIHALQVTPDVVHDPDDL